MNVVQYGMLVHPGQLEQAFEYNSKCRVVKQRPINPTPKVCTSGEQSYNDINGRMCVLMYCHSDDSETIGSELASKEIEPITDILYFANENLCLHVYSQDLKSSASRTIRNW